MRYPDSGFLGIRARLALLAAVVLPLVTLGTAFYTSREGARLISMDAFERVRTIGRTFSFNCEYGLLIRDSSKLDNVIQGVVDEPDVKFAAVVDGNGEVVSTLDPSAAGRQIRTSLGRLHRGAVAESLLVTMPPYGSVYLFSYPVVTEDAPESNEMGLFDSHAQTGHRILGHAVVGYCPARVEERIAQTRRGLAVVLAVLSLALLSTVFLFVNGWVRNIRHLLRATQRAGAGDLSTQVNIRSHDEIEELGRGFNKMIRDLRFSVVSIETLQGEQQRFLDVAEISGDWIWETDARGRIVYSNGMAAEVVGYGPDELVGRELSGFLRVDGHPVPGTFLEEATRNEPIRSTVFRFFHRSGRAIDIEMSAVTVLDRNGQVIGFRGVNRDVSERRDNEENLRQAKDRAEAADRAKSSFLANMSHEIRTPMNGILGLARLLEETPLNAEQREFAGAIRNSGDALLIVINDILDISKIEADKIEIEEVEFDLIAVLENVNSIMFLRAEERGLEYNAVIDPEVPQYLRGDPGRIRQILINLTGNAIKFTKEGEVRLHIALAGVGPESIRLRFSIEDTGIGIAPEAAERLFQPFQQADASTTRKFGGTGLGLAISKRLAEKMGGEIGVESNRPTGSTFWFTALLRPVGAGGPAVQPAGGGFGPAVSPPPAADRPRARVLVLDPCEASRRSISALLARWGVPGEETSEALATFRLLAAATEAREPFTLVVVSGSLLDRGAEEFARRLRAEWCGPQPELALLISLTKWCADARLSELGFTSTLAKPIRAAQLQALLWRTGKEADGGGAPRARSAGPRRRRPKNRTERILVVEDNKINQLVITKLLGRQGFVPDVAENGRQAIEALEQTSFDLVLMDCQMPEMDGYDATRLIRSGQTRVRNPRIPIIAMTAYSLSGDRDKCVDAGMDDYVSKPIQEEALVAVLHRWVGDPGEELEDCAAA